MIDTKARFYNALTGSLSLLSEPDSYFTNPATPNFTKSPRWYTKESDPSFYAPHILISGPHNRNRDIVKDIGIGKDTLVFGDSGGFQLSTGKVTETSWNRKIALEWSEANANLFPILDMPAGGIVKSVKDAIDYTVASAKYYADNRTRSDRQILNVLSASSVSKIKEWYNAVKEFKFDGWAFGAHSNSLVVILSGIKYLVDQGEFDTSEPRPLHIFGTTSTLIIPYLLYVQNLLNEKGIHMQLSFDSSSASSMVNYGNYIQYCSPKGMAITTVSNQHPWGNLDDHSRFGCRCPLCSDATDLKYLFSEEGKGQFYMVIATHNYYKMRYYKRVYEGLINLNNKDALKSLSVEFARNAKMIDDAFNIPGDAGLKIIKDMRTSRRKNEFVRTPVLDINNHSGE